MSREPGLKEINLYSFLPNQLLQAATSKKKPEYIQKMTIRPFFQLLQTYMSQLYKDFKKGVCRGFKGGG